MAGQPAHRACAQQAQGKCIGRVAFQARRWLTRLTCSCHHCPSTLKMAQEGAWDGGKTGESRVLDNPAEGGVAGLLAMHRALPYRTCQAAATVNENARGDGGSHRWPRYLGERGWDQVACRDSGRRRACRLEPSLDDPPVCRPPPKSGGCCGGSGRSLPTERCVVGPHLGAAQPILLSMATGHSSPRDRGPPSGSWRAGCLRGSGYTRAGG
jgi:hypothetical protein